MDATTRLYERLYDIKVGEEKSDWFLRLPSCCTTLIQTSCRIYHCRHQGSIRVCPVHCNALGGCSPRKLQTNSRNTATRRSPLDLFGQSELHWYPDRKAYGVTRLG